MLAQLALRIAPVAVSVGQVRFQANRLIIISHGGLIPAQLALRYAPVVVGFDIVRLQLNRPVIVGKGFLVFA